MASTVSGDLLRELAVFRTATGCALSLYLDLHPSVTPTIPDVDAHFRARLAEAEKTADSMELDRDCRLAVKRDVERLRRWWETDFDRDGAHGLAVFASSAEDLFLALPLAGRVADTVRVRADLHLLPLVDQLGREGTLVAVVSRERGQVFRVRNGRLQEVADETAEQPGQHDQGGWSQANYQRHIEHLVEQHLKTVGGAIDRRLRDGLQMVVVAPEEMRGVFVAKLSQEARDAVIGWTSAEAHAGPTELLEVVRPVLEEADARRHEDALRRLDQELGRGGRASAGWQDTLDAAADGRVERLLLTVGGDRTLWLCPVCGRGFAADGTCPVDGLALLERADGADLAAHLVLAAGGDVLQLGAGALPHADGIAALLRF
jgi:peptide chain release factor subunit 1